jgi:hypothetical protein
MDRNGIPERGRRRTWLAGLIAGLAIMSLLAIYRNPLFSTLSLHRVDDYPLYVMHVYGDYEWDEFLQRGISAGAPGQQTAAGRVPWGCSVFAAATSEGDRIVGRNFDWHNRGSLLLFTHPPTGYASVSMVDLSYLVDDVERLGLAERSQLMEAPYWPFDGMNEAGLGVGMMAVSHGRDRRDTSLPTIGSLHAIRLMLDRAASVEEAIALLEDYVIDFEGGPPVHYLVADATGESVVVEFIDGTRSVVVAEEPWQVSTNFHLTGVRGDAGRGLCERYATAQSSLQAAGGTLSGEEAMGLLERVSQGITMWSVIYDLTGGGIEVAVGRDYETIHTFHLPMRGQER